MNAEAKKGCRPVEVLIVEDNPGDAYLIRETLKNCRIPTNTHLVTDGVQALDFLRNREPHGLAPRPDLIFLDLNMPKKDGREVLEELKKDPALMDIPTLVLTTSAWNQDIVTAYASKANFYIIKPMDAGHFKAYMSYIEEIWLKTVRPQEG